MKKLGNICSDTAVINFENVHVPVKNVIGEMNAGFTYQMMQFQEERLVLGKKWFIVVHIITLIEWIL